MRNCLPIFILLFTFYPLKAQEVPSAFHHDIEGEKKPWTGKPFYNDPDNFQFAVISDRTGGHRVGVFGDALNKINKLYPEFVMSVGDLIEGYTNDHTVIDSQWNEFNGILDSLSTRFFYVAGNHDYSNSAMAEQWKDRYGKDYYHFIYKNVLFLILNSNDGDGVLMGEDQIAAVEEIISKNENVRWTMLFMHHPLWLNSEANGFDKIEKALADKKYTAFAGHTHRYMHHVKNDKNHYVLGTSGGGSKLRGPKFGEFDHIGWVTMTDEGPKLVNLSLSGILDHDISNTTSHEMASALILASDLKTMVLEKDQNRKIIIQLNNPTKDTIFFQGNLYHHHQILANHSSFDLKIAPNSNEQLELLTSPIKEGGSEEWDPLELAWQMGFKKDFMAPDFSLSGIKEIPLDPTTTEVQITEKNIFLKELNVQAAHSYKEVLLTYTIIGENANGSPTVMPENLLLNKTSALSLVFIDESGYKSLPLIKEFEKVEPSASVKVKRPRPGLQYTYYEGKFNAVPDFTTLNPLTSGIAAQLSPDKIAKQMDNYAIQYTGYINIPETAVYNFYLTSDDGSILYIDDVLTVDNDGSHSLKTKTGLKALAKGMHKIRIDYFEDFDGQELILEYSRDGSPKTPVSLWHRQD